MTKASKVTNVQVPGEVAANATPATQPEKQAEPAPVKAEVRGARDYRNTPASEIDPKTLQAPVLSADGWVCPN